MSTRRMSDERFDAVCVLLDVEREHLTKEMQAHEDEGRKEAAEATSAVHDALVEALCELRRLREKEQRSWPGHPNFRETDDA